MLAPVLRNWGGRAIYLIILRDSIVRGVAGAETGAGAGEG